LILEALERTHSMTPYRVLYRTEKYNPDEAPSSVNLADYREVATVESDDLETLFREMNCVDGTETCCRLRVRSLSVGDVAIDPSGSAFYCASCGWEPVTVTVGRTIWERLGADG